MSSYEAARETLQREYAQLSKLLAEALANRCRNPAWVSVSGETAEQVIASYRRRLDELRKAADQLGITFSVGEQEEG